MPRRPLSRAPFALAATAAVLTVGACVPNQPEVSGPTTTGAGTVSVSSTSDGCRLSTAEAAAGTVTFRVRNDGSDVTEFYLLGPDGLRVLAEAENIGPGLSRDLVVRLEPGTYRTACKPGMVGDGIKAPFTVVGSAATVDASRAEVLSAAQTSYVAYVRDQTEQLLAGTRRFADAYTSGDDAAARSLYAATRVHWERVEPVAESFGDLDPLLDLRQADLTAGQAWTGWHLLEKDLWAPDAAANGAPYVPLTAAERRSAADQLVATTQQLMDRVTAADFTVEASQIANGAKELLDEVATGKVTGEEETWSHTDLWDLQANLDGARVAYQVLADLVRATDPDLASELDERFQAVSALMATHGSYDAGFAAYDSLGADEVKQLSVAVDALSEPLSRLAAAVVAA
ncbi:iron uptake system protein EfeO [Cellulomonas sp. NTE-D12]|uniref:iron uptake system protein EfeO n=1 Tax=Cellulomonas sp. NTE-D12 TaxID=2962632 RepID=UPI00308123A2|nr:hypothetical protein CELD12_09860 [Cellulomonas sp. NTE-D12]